MDTVTIQTGICRICRKPIQKFSDKGYWTHITELHRHIAMPKKIAVKKGVN